MNYLTHEQSAHDGGHRKVLTLDPAQFSSHIGQQAFAVSLLWADPDPGIYPQEGHCLPGLPRASKGYPAQKVPPPL